MGVLSIPVGGAAARPLSAAESVVALDRSIVMCAAVFGFRGVHFRALLLVLL